MLPPVLVLKPNRNAKIENKIKNKQFLLINQFFLGNLLMTGNLVEKLHETCYIQNIFINRNPNVVVNKCPNIRFVVVRSNVRSILLRSMLIVRYVCCLQVLLFLHNEKDEEESGSAELTDRNPSLKRGVHSSLIKT